MSSQNRKLRRQHKHQEFLANQNGVKQQDPSPQPTGNLASISDAELEAQIAAMLLAAKSAPPEPPRENAPKTDPQLASSFENEPLRTLGNSRPGIGGPVTPAGKARSSQNSFKHGLASGFSHFKFLPGENPAEYFELVADLNFQFVPRTGAERKKIEDMAQAWWLQRRARDLQTCALESADDKAFALYLRYETTQRRSYQMAYKDFQDMVKHRLSNAASPDLTPIVTPTLFTSDRIYPAPEPLPSADPPPDQPLAA